MLDEKSKADHEKIKSNFTEILNGAKALRDTINEAKDIIGRSEKDKGERDSLIKAYSLYMSLLEMDLSFYVNVAENNEICTTITRDIWLRLDGIESRLDDITRLKPIVTTLEKLAQERKDVTTVWKYKSHIMYIVAIITAAAATLSIDNILKLMK